MEHVVTVRDVFFMLAALAVCGGVTIVVFHALDWWAGKWRD